LHGARRLSIVAAMKRILPLVLCLLAARPLLAQAADSLPEAAALAAQRDAEERYKRLAADVQTLLETQELIQKRQEEFRQRLDKLSDEIRTAKEDIGRSTVNLASREELRSLIEKLKEQLDEQREADKKLILGSIKELAKAPPPPVEHTPPPRPKEEERTSEEPPYIYVVKKNDQLGFIIAEYNNYFQKHGQPRITLEDVVKANPGLNPNLLLTGKKIHIPFPSKESK
jgi:septal ring factor EnvC (AmiA/AmiB activator)